MTMNSVNVRGTMVKVGDRVQVLVSNAPFLCEGKVTVIVPHLGHTDCILRGETDRGVPFWVHCDDVYPMEMSSRSDFAKSWYVSGLKVVA